MVFGREILYNTLKFPDYEVVAVEALTWRNLM